ncbi:MAG: fructose-6-phosphate aldolase [Planctomycetota bacterium]|jgi:TalC/MipB family fructose-6-phosphate aldolase|nr:fructose-6-phosphate aldolase [Planctomycetota bacterium]
MEFMIDNASIEEIERALDVFPITGVTSNPSILKAEGKTNLFPHMREIRKLIGSERSLHIQVIAEDAEGIIEEAETLRKRVDEEVYIKVPTTEQGLKAIRILKSRGVNVTATAIYLKIQGFMAIALEADFIAPYYNRMENLDMNPDAVIASFRKMIEENKVHTKILSASFKNMSQVMHSFECGSHVATVQPTMLHDVFHTPEIQKAVDDFHADWIKTQGDVSITALTSGRFTTVLPRRQKSGSDILSPK